MTLDPDHGFGLLSPEDHVSGGGVALLFVLRVDLKAFLLNSCNHYNAKRARHVIEARGDPSASSD
jgi:hypothetical protein